ncbi:unnamed protein product, partial [marine sediment metagenome]
MIDTTRTLTVLFDHPFSGLDDQLSVVGQVRMREDTGAQYFG